MRIAVDLDNTLVDEFGKRVRPGIVNVLARLKAEGHTLILFTQSTRERARIILRDHGLEAHFAEFLYREDWDRENVNPPKNLLLCKADALIDDDPQHVQAARELGKIGVLVASYRGGSRIDPKETERILGALRTRTLDRLKRMFGK